MDDTEARVRATTVDDERAAGTDDKRREGAIAALAAAWHTDSPVAWNVAVSFARRAGLDDETILACADGRYEGSEGEQLVQHAVADLSRGAALSPDTASALGSSRARQLRATVLRFARLALETEVPSGTRFSRAEAVAGAAPARAEAGGAWLFGCLLEHSRVRSPA